MALMPATPHRPHQTDLLLCAHHYRAARSGLAEAGATVLDETGHALASTDAWLVSAPAQCRDEGLTDTGGRSHG